MNKEILELIQEIEYESKESKLLEYDLRRHQLNDNSFLVKETKWALDRKRIRIISLADALVREIRELGTTERSDNA